MHWQTKDNVALPNHRVVKLALILYTLYTIGILWGRSAATTFTIDLRASQPATWLAGMLASSHKQPATTGFVALFHTIVHTQHAGSTRLVVRKKEPNERRSLVGGV